jgi:hypothetical protein
LLADFLNGRSLRSIAVAVRTNNDTESAQPVTSETRRRLSSGKTGRLVQFEIMEQTRNPLQDSLADRGPYRISSRVVSEPHSIKRQYARRARIDEFDSPPVLDSLAFQMH